MNHYRVIANFKDVRTGALVAKGSDWSTEDEAQGKRLERAGCIVRAPAPVAPAAPPAPAGDPAPAPAAAAPAAPKAKKKGRGRAPAPPAPAGE